MAVKTITRIPNLPLEVLQQSVIEVLRDDNIKKYLDERMKKYGERTRYRKVHAIPVMAVCGPGGAGKDSFAGWWCIRAKLPIPTSTSGVMAPLIGCATGMEPRVVYNERRHHRKFWQQWLNVFRASDPTLIAKLNLADCDVVNGMRGLNEFYAVTSAKIADFSVWIDRTDEGEDIEYGPDDCDFVITNRGSIREFLGRCDRLFDLTSCHWFQV